MFFVDGGNFYRRLEEEAGVADPNRLDLRKVAAKLAGPRQVVGIRYYTGKVEGSGSSAVFRAQQRLLASLTKQGVVPCLGRMERRDTKNPLAEQLLAWLGQPQPPEARLPDSAYRQLHRLASENRQVSYWVQKAVDTLIVVDIARLAIDDAYDVGYLLSKDGDLTPGVALARQRGKTVFGVGPEGKNYQMAQACNHFIRIDRKWLQDCYLE